MFLMDFMIEIWFVESLSLRLKAQVFLAILNEIQSQMKAKSAKLFQFLLMQPFLRVSKPKAKHFEHKNSGCYDYS